MKLLLCINLFVIKGKKISYGAKLKDNVGVYEYLKWRGKAVMEIKIIKLLVCVGQKKKMAP